MPVHAWFNIAPRSDREFDYPHGIQRKLTADDHSLLGAAMSRILDGMGAGIVSDDGRYLATPRQAVALATAARAGNAEFALYCKASTDENADEDTGLVARVYPCHESGANIDLGADREPRAE